MSDAIGGLAGVIVFTEPARFEAMRDFYRDTLGLPVRNERDGRIAFAWPSAPDVRIILTTHAEARGPNADPARVMLHLLVDDLEAVASRLRTASVAFLREPAREHFGGYVATLRDPDGNLVQLLQNAAG